MGGIKQHRNGFILFKGCNLSYKIQFEIQESKSVGGSPRVTTQSPVEEFERMNIAMDPARVGIGAAAGRREWGGGR